MGGIVAIACVSRVGKSVGLEILIMILDWLVSVFFLPLSLRVAFDCLLGWLRPVPMCSPFLIVMFSLSETA